MNFLGLDLSYSATGFYLIQQGAKDIRFEIITKPSDFMDDLSRSEHIAQYIIDKIKDIKVDFIAMEDYFAGKQPNSVMKLAILGTVIRFTLLKNGYSFMTFAPTQIKKFETGSGNAPKDIMLKSVFKKHGFDTTSNNVADACAIAFLGKGYCEWMNGRREFLQYETQVLKKVSKERKKTVPYEIDLSLIKTKGENE